MSTAKANNKHRFVITSKLGKLLAKRNLSQKEFSLMTGISERAISRIKNRKIVNRIDCDSAIKICLALSLRKAVHARTRARISLDELFPMVHPKPRTAKSRITPSNG
jgi:DNA-binding Xre family transcriptional regulator